MKMNLDSYKKKKITNNKFIFRDEDNYISFHELLFASFKRAFGTNIYHGNLAQSNIYLSIVECRSREKLDRIQKRKLLLGQRLGFLTLLRSI